MKPTKEEVQLAMDLHPPTPGEIFFVKHFSKNSVTPLAGKISILLFVPLIMGFFAAVIGLPDLWIEIPGSIFSFLLTAFGLYWIFNWYKANWRHRRIRRILKLSRVEYNMIIDEYFPE